jgi:hypothetical protein
MSNECQKSKVVHEVVIWILFELDSPSVHHFVRDLAFEISLNFFL